MRYRSYYFDSDTGFYYLQSRYYDPVTHRFINADGLVSTGTGVLGHNMFIYCNNNPVNYFDPSGNETMKQVGEAVAGIIPNDLGWTIMDVTFAQAAGLDEDDQFYKIGSTDSSYTVYVIYEYHELNYVPFTAWIYDNRYKINLDNPDPNYKVLNSYLYLEKAIRKQIIETIIDYNNSNPRPINGIWNMTYDDMEIEWEAHNYCYNLGFQRARAAEVDFNMNENKKILFTFFAN